MIAVVAMLVLSLGGTPKAYGLTKDQVAIELREANFFTKTPGMSLALCEGKQCITHAEGYTDIYKDNAMSTASQFRVGSLSKHVVAVMTLILAEQEKISLQDKLETYFPQYSQWSDITIQDLLRMQSGIPPYLMNIKSLRTIIWPILQRDAQYLKPSFLLKTVRTMPLLLKPGSSFNYSNSNYLLLGRILEIATGTAFENLAKELIFDPLSMDSSFFPTTFKPSPRLVSGYVPGEALTIPKWLFNRLPIRIKKFDYLYDTTEAFHPSVTWAAGSLISTPTDMLKFSKGLFSGKLLNRESIAKMKQTTKGILLGFPIEYGLGVMKLFPWTKGFWGHGGLTPGYQSLVAYEEGSDFVMALFQNKGPATANNVYVRLLNLREQGPKHLEEFQPQLEEIPENFKNGLSFRVKGQLLSETAPQPNEDVNPSIGQGRIRWPMKEKNSFQSFHTRLINKDGEEWVQVKGYALGLGDILGDQSGVKAIPIVKVTIKKDLLKNTSPHQVISIRSKKFITASYGVEVVDTSGILGECMRATINYNQTSKIQVATNPGETLKEGATIKILGNVPMIIDKGRGKECLNRHGLAPGD